MSALDRALDRIGKMPLFMPWMGVSLLGQPIARGIGMRSAQQDIQSGRFKPKAKGIKETEEDYKKRVRRATIDYKENKADTYRNIFAGASSAVGLGLLANQWRMAAKTFKQQYKQYQGGSGGGSYYGSRAGTGGGGYSSGRGRSYGGFGRSTQSEDPLGFFGSSMKKAKTKRDAQNIYRSEALKHHPDKNPQDPAGATEKMKKVNAMWSELKNTSFYEKLAYLLKAEKMNEFEKVAKSSFFDELEKYGYSVKDIDLSLYDDDDLKKAKLPWYRRGDIKNFSKKHRNIGRAVGGIWGAQLGAVGGLLAGSALPDKLKRAAIITGLLLGGGGGGYGLGKLYELRGKELQTKFENERKQLLLDAIKRGDMELQ